MRSIGGKTVVLKTEDGVLIEAMFFDASVFHDRVVAMGGSFQTNHEGKQVILSNNFPRLNYMFDKMKMPCKGHLWFGSQIVLDRPEGILLPTTRQKQVMIVTQGNAAIFEMNRHDIARALLSGMSCIAFNIRGTGRSHGSPSEEGTYKDVEAIYQYLLLRGFQNHQISIYGYCIGSGLSTHLASKHPIHLILDRPFARIADPMSQAVSDQIIDYFLLDAKSQKIIRMKECFERALSFFINYCVISYDNGSKLPSVRGPICMIQSGKDELIPERSRAELQSRLSTNRRASLRTSNQIDHTDDWDAETESFFVEFLQSRNILRQFPNAEGGRDVRQIAASFLAPIRGRIGASAAISKSESISR
jgi:pimeloyl-ACP methyl ester carboxylesterase